MGGGGGGVAIQSFVQQFKIYSNKWGHLAKGPSIAARGRRRVLHFSEAGFKITTYAIHSRVHFAEVLRCFFLFLRLKCKSYKWINCPKDENIIDLVECICIIY